MREIAVEVNKLFYRMEKAVEEAIHKEELRSDLNPQLASIIIIGSIGQFYGYNIYYQRKGHNNIEFKDLIDTILKGLE